MDSPYEVHDYVRAYLGDTPEAKDFAKQFIERRAKQNTNQHKQAAPNQQQAHKQQQQVRRRPLWLGWLSVWKATLTGLNTEVCLRAAGAARLTYLSLECSVAPVVVDTAAVNHLRHNTGSAPKCVTGGWIC